MPKVDHAITSARRDAWVPGASLGLLGAAQAAHPADHDDVAFAPGGGTDLTA